MARYRCDSCEQLRDDKVCPVCLSDTTLLDPETASLEGLAATVSRNAAPMQPFPGRVLQPPPPPQVRTPPPAALHDDTRVVPPPPARPHTAAEVPQSAIAPSVTPPPSAARPAPDIPPTVQRQPPSSPPPVAESRPAPPEPPREPVARRVPEPPPRPIEPSNKDIRGLEEFHALLDRGMRSVIICGRGKTGKSELASGFIRANNVYRGRAQNLTLRATLRTEYVLGATNADEVWYQIIDDKLAFLDPSGEFFKLLSQDYRQQFQLPDITEEDFRFVQRAVRGLGGIVLAVDLMEAIDRKASFAWQQQEEDLKFVLSALRWLRYDQEARPAAIGLSAHIAQRFSTFPLLDVPVLVLFTKADRLGQLSIGNPLEFAKVNLPFLHGALMTHARRFRFDFCHTMEHTSGGDQAVKYPCGVLLPMEWLMSNATRWLRWQLPTRFIGGGK